MDPIGTPGAGATGTVEVTPSEDVASPPLIVGEVGLALALALVLGFVLRTTWPAPSPSPRLLRTDLTPVQQTQTRPGIDSGIGSGVVSELPLDVSERTTEVPLDDEESPTTLSPLPVTEELVPPPVGVYALFQSALGRSRAILQSGLDRILGRPVVDAVALDDLEEALLRADVGVATTERLLTKVREVSGATGDPQQVRKALRSEMQALLDSVHAPLTPRPDLWVILVVGVNGSGKTTTIGKLAARLKGEGRKVLLAAGDTYRAAAEQQLAVWAERAGVDIVALDEGADPAAVAFKALERARKEGHDVVIVDTAGRLQTRKPLMEQLGKVRRVIDKALPGAPHETLLVLDGTIGQNGLSQAKLFHEATPITGVVITKLDGTAKGGMILAVATETGLPVKLVGLGEKVGDLRDFEPAAFVEALM
jgi:fused signal recognition particle receptor